MAYNFSFQTPIKNLTEDFNGDKKFFIEGTAVEETTSRNGITYVARELELAAPSLQDKPLLKDHDNKVDNIVGRVTKSSYNAVRKAVEFKAQVMDSKIKEMVSDGRLKNVSIGASVKGFREEESNGTNLKIAEGIEILELSFTPVPGVPGATLHQALGESYEVFKREQEKVVVEGKTCTVVIEEDLKTQMATMMKKMQVMPEGEEKELMKKKILLMKKQMSMEEETMETVPVQENKNPTVDIAPLMEQIKKLQEEMTALKLVKVEESTPKAVFKSPEPVKETGYVEHLIMENGTLSYWKENKKGGN